MYYVILLTTKLLTCYQAYEDALTEKPAPKITRVKGTLKKTLICVQFISA